MPTLEVSEETLEKIKSQLGIEVKEIENLEDLVGQKYLFECARYFYYGKVKKVTPTYIELTDCGKVFDVGQLDAKSATDFQKTPSNIFVMRGAIESFYRPKW